MTLASVKAGDIVHVDKKGRRFFATVVSTDDLSTRARQISIDPICRDGATITYRTASAREVVGIYRRAKGSASA